MIIMQRIRRLKDDAEMAWADGDISEGARIDAEISSLLDENQKRLNAARNRFFAIDDEDVRDNGVIAAYESVISTNGIKTFRSLGDRALEMCEFWEAVADSAWFIMDT